MQLTPNSHLVNITKTTADITINSDFTAASKAAANEPLLSAKKLFAIIDCQIQEFQLLLAKLFLI